MNERQFPPSPYRPIVNSIATIALVQAIAIVIMALALLGGGV